VTAPQPHPKPRIVYLHGDGVLYWSWGWVARLEEELRQAGFPRFFELFPDSIEARAKYWMPFLEEYVRVTAEDVLLGWSCGAVAAMRVAEQHRVRGLVLVAPYFTDLGLDVVRRSGWVDAPWDWQRIRANTDHVAIFQSDADPYVSARELTELAQHVQADVRVLSGAGHFGDQDCFPELSDYIVRTYGQGSVRE
jgi:uncharacterized protein